MDVSYGEIVHVQFSCALNDQIRLGINLTVFDDAFP